MSTMHNPINQTQAQRTEEHHHGPIHRRRGGISCAGPEGKEDAYDAVD
jgi:hypothetical protein